MSSYRVTMTDTTGATTTVTDLDQDAVDALIDEHEARNSAQPVGVVERQKRDGSWVANGGWDVRPRDLTARTAEPVDHAAARTAEMLAVAAINDEADRRDQRRARYLRTGR